MRLSVGYSLVARERFLDALERWAPDIDELYFAWPGTPSGRADLGERNPEYKQNRVDELLEDLRFATSLGIDLVLLLNGNCYGESALSDDLADSTRHIVDRVGGEAGRLIAVTLASPFLAKSIKQSHPGLGRRASVNMRVGTVEALDYLGDLFDEYYVQKERNRDPVSLMALREAATAADKRLWLLANSGCLNWCPNQTFHDNLVSHELDLRVTARDDFNPILCREYLGRKADLAVLIERSNWIRPEETEVYKSVADGIKLATRMHARPDLIIAAYVRRSYSGNVLDLLEPGFSALFQPTIFRNEAFPEGWMDMCRSEGRAAVEKLLAQVLLTLA
jgi:collagenase-like PrtC family protease